jgi:Rv2525c-like, glycoside hydrolase-like domain
MPSNFLMKRAVHTFVIAAAVFGLYAVLHAGAQSEPTAASYLGFDRNDYPGDENLPALRQTFSYAGFWLNNPPGAHSNSWTGKRQLVQSAGLGFLVLFNGRLDAELKSVSNAGKLAKSDAQTAADAARREGFPAEAIIFLDQEQGGRMLPEQKAYIYAWVDGITAAGFRAGVYCSGIPATDDENIVTADDIRKSAGSRSIVYFVSDDACPPAPGCVFPKRDPRPADSGIRFADVWQFAQSPRRAEFTAKCSATYNPDGNCYPPGVDMAKHLHVDVETASSPDPSQGRSR